MKYWTQDVVIDPHDPTQNTWYAGGWGTVSFTSGTPNPNTLAGLYKTTNRGLRWTRIFTGESVQSCTIHPAANHRNEMYLSTRFSGLMWTIISTIPRAHFHSRGRLSLSPAGAHFL